jgi:phenylacetate-coenzyme A ligase PaaK-like adenylate-forming protein
MQMLINYCYTKKETLPQSVRYIEFLSEVLTSAVREQTERLIPGVKIANMYGSEEMNAIAYECPCGKMHVISENVLAECFDGEKISPYGEGRIVLTNLHNRVNPLIRYDQGDEVTLSIETKCNCGYTDKLITSLSGRVSSSTVINGQRLSTCDVSDIMLIVSNKYGHPLMKYKFVYDSDSNSIMCYTVFNNEYINWRHEIWKTIESLFQARYGNINMNFCLDDYDKNKYKQDLFVVI